MLGRRRAWGLLAVLGLVLAGCSSPRAVGTAAPGTTDPPRSSTTVAVTITATTLPPTTAAPSTTAVPPTAASSPTTAKAPVATTTAPAGAVAFSGTISRVAAADLPSSWRPGCPVAPEDLRLLAMSFWGFDGVAHSGTMVVHASVAQAVVDVFHRLYDRRFPIRRMEPVDGFGGSDDASIAADNTAGFNCRNAVASGPPRWSAHAYGQAIDVNPVENPYVEGGQILPPAGAAYVDRSVVRPGMAVRGGELTTAFAAAGWYWGGTWADPDYQHFSATGG